MFCSALFVDAIRWTLCLGFSLSNLLWELSLEKFQVVQAAGGRVPVFLDGGVRRGTDVLKALALGASGVFVSTLPLRFCLRSSDFCTLDSHNVILVTFPCLLNNIVSVVMLDQSVVSNNDFMNRLRCADASTGSAHRILSFTSRVLIWMHHGCRLEGP